MKDSFTRFRSKFNSLTFFSKFLRLFYAQINDDSTTLGLSSQYKWNRRQAPTLPTPLGNKYSALDGDSTIGGSFGRHNSNDQYHSKGSRGRDSYST